MSTPDIRVVVFLLLGLLSEVSHSNELISPVETDVDVPTQLAEQLSGEWTLRYRYVSVDIEHLWSLFESARELKDFDDVEPLTFDLFPDLSVEMKLVKLKHRYWSSNATLVSTRPGFGTDPASNIFATMTLERGKTARARIWVGGEVYHISPVESGPVHVILQANMKYWRDNSDM